MAARGVFGFMSSLTLHEARGCKAVVVREGLARAQVRRWWRGEKKVPEKVPGKKVKKVLVPPWSLLFCIAVSVLSRDPSRAAAGVVGANGVRAWLGLPLRGAAGCQVSGGIAPDGLRYHSSSGLSFESETRKGWTARVPETSFDVCGEDDMSRVHAEDEL